MTINDFAPYPQHEEDVTADRIARSNAVSAFARQRLIDELMNDTSPKGSRLYMSEIGTLVNQYGVVFLLRELAEVAPERADAAAGRLYGDWEDGGSVGECLWVWLREYGIDPEHVNALASERARESAKKLKDADSDMEQLKRGGKELGKVIDFMAGLIKDAYLRGADDPVGALHMLGDYLLEIFEEEGGLSDDEHGRVYRALEEHRKAAVAKARA